MLGLSALVAPWELSAQHNRTTVSRRIGILWLGTTSTTLGPSSREARFRDSLRQFGWVEGQNLAVETRFVGDGGHPAGEAEELVAMKVDAIVAMGAPIALAVRGTTNSVPVVFVVFGDPVQSGLIVSLARPGGNLTGIYMPTAEHAGKRLELLHEAVPGSDRIAVLRFAGSAAGYESALTRAAAQKLGIQLEEITAGTMEDLDAALLACKKTGATALTILAEPRTSISLGRVAEICLVHQLPSIAGYAGYAWLGGLMAYGADGFEGIRRAAYLVSRILNGARPADLPVEQSTKYVLALNRKTARKLQLRFPHSLVQYANVVVF